MKLKTEFIDIHSHLLPIQDGPEDTEQAIRSIQIAQENNITDMIFTPHYYSWDTSYKHNDIAGIFETIREEISKNKLQTRVYIGNECVIDENIVKDLQAGRAFTLNHTQYVLCEYPSYQVPCNYQNILYQMLDKGYKPILAHPERNAYIESNYSSIVELKENGCEIQINAASLLGKYGHLAKKTSKRMLKEQIVDYIASDAHSDIHRKADVLKKAYLQAVKGFDREYIEKLFSENPGNMIG